MSKTHTKTSGRAIVPRTHRVHWHATHTYEMQMGLHKVVVKGHNETIPSDKLAAVVQALQDLNGESIAKVNTAMRYFLPHATITVSASKVFDLEAVMPPTKRSADSL